MTGYVGPIEKVTEKNKYFRQVLFTGKHLQLVVMCLQPKEEIGNEVHEAVDQFFRIEEGRAKFVLNGSEEHVVGAGGAVVVPAGTYHNVINASPTKPLKLYTLYTPPEQLIMGKRPAAIRAIQYRALQALQPRMANTSGVSAPPPRAVGSA